MTTFFTCTSSKNYDRHTYEILTNDNQIIRFEHWNEMQNYWFQHSVNLQTVFVKDKNLGFGK